MDANNKKQKITWMLAVWSPGAPEDTQIRTETILLNHRWNKNQKIIFREG